MILRIDTQVGVGGVEIRTETHDEIASLSPEETSPNQLMNLSRNHRGIENKLHFIKDRRWDEDRRWSRRPSLAERLAVLRDSALTSLRLIPNLPDDLPLRAPADHLGRNVRKALKFIGALN